VSWQAECRKDECGHGWTLQKHPEDYASGVTCPQCSTTQVTIKETGDSGSGGNEIVRKDDGGGRQQPAQQGGGGLSSDEVAGSAIALLDSNAPAEARGEAASNMGNFAGDLLRQGITYFAKKKEARNERAANASLERKDVYPDCNECGFQFTGDQISLQSNEVQCPECGVVYEIRDAEGVQDPS
jgi:hypothetical protein